MATEQEKQRLLRLRQITGAAATPAEVLRASSGAAVNPKEGTTIRTRYGAPGAVAQTIGRTAANVGREVLKTPVRLAYSLIDVPRTFMGKEPLPAVDLGYGLGTAQSAQRTAADASRETGSAVQGILRGGSQGILDAAVVGGLAGAAGAAKGAATGGKYRYIDRADDIMKETDELLKANPSVARGAAATAGVRRVDPLARSINQAIYQRPRRGGRETIPRQDFKNAHREDVKEIVKFIDDVRLPKRKPTTQQEVTMTRLAERFGINPNQSPARIANAFTKKLDENPGLIRK